MKLVKLLSIAVFFVLATSNVFAQNNKPNLNPRNVYLIRIWNHNNELKSDKKKVEVVAQKLKNKLLMNANFIYLTPLNNDQFILVGSNNQLIDGSIIQKIFEPYLIKINIIQVKEISNITFDFSKIPIYLNQKVNSFNKKLLNWENKNKKVVDNIKNLF